MCSQSSSVILLAEVFLHLFVLKSIIIVFNDSQLLFNQERNMTEKLLTGI